MPGGAARGGDTSPDYSFGVSEFSPQAPTGARSASSRGFSALRSGRGYRDEQKEEQEQGGNVTQDVGVAVPGDAFKGVVKDLVRGARGLPTRRTPREARVHAWKPVPSRALFEEMKKHESKVLEGQKEDRERACRTLDRQIQEIELNKREYGCYT